MVLSIWFEISGGASPSPKKNLGKKHISVDDVLRKSRVTVPRCDICPGHWDLQLGWKTVIPIETVIAQKGHGSLK